MEKQPVCNKRDAVLVSLVKLWVPSVEAVGVVQHVPLSGAWCSGSCTVLAGIRHFKWWREKKGKCVSEMGVFKLSMGFY